jgi:hypothetical protein
MLGTDVAPEEGKRRPVRAGVRQLAAQQPVLHRVGIEGDAGEETDGRDQAHQQAAHEQPVVPEPPRGYRGEGEEGE